MSKNKSLYFIGGLNMDFLNPTHHVTKKMKSFLKRSNLSQLVDFPNRICNTNIKTSETLIDFVITNSKNQVLSVQQNSVDQMADHRDLIITLNLKITKPKLRFVKTFRDKRHYSKENLVNSLVASGITFSVSNDDIEIAAAFFSNCFLNTLNEICPEKTVTFKYEFGKNNSPELEAAFEHKKKILQKLSHSRSNKLVTELRLATRKFDNILARENIKFYEKSLKSTKTNRKSYGLACIMWYQ